MSSDVAQECMSWHLNSYGIVTQQSYAPCHGTIERSLVERVTWKLRANCELTQGNVSLPFRLTQHSNDKWWI